MKFFKNLIAKIIGKHLKKKIDLEEGPVKDKKKWYRSRNVWTGIVTVLISAYMSIDSQLAPVLGFDLPNIPDFIFVILGSLGIYTRVDATKKIG